MRQKKSNLLYLFPIFALWFVAAPVLGTQETADPGAGYVLLIVIPTLLLGLTYLKLNLMPLHIAVLLMWFLCTCVNVLGPFSSNIDPMQNVKYLAFVVFFIVITNYKFTGKDLKFITKGYVIIAIIVAALIVLSYLKGYQHLSLSGDGGTNIYLGRYSIGITGLYKNPNYLASFICVAALVVLFRMKENTMTILKQVLFLCITILFFVSCFLTGTRAALVVLLFTIIVILFPSFFNSVSLKNSIIPITFLCLILVMYGSKIGSIMDLFLAGRDLMVDEGRERAWLMALRFVGGSLLLGYGVDSWHFLSRGAGPLINLHNVFLEFFLNQGLIGLILLVYTVLYGFNRAKKDDKLFLIMLLLVTAIPLCFQNGVVAVNFWRFIIINRIALNYSIQSKEGINALFKET